MQVRKRGGREADDADVDTDADDTCVGASGGRVEDRRSLDKCVIISMLGCEAEKCFAGRGRCLVPRGGSNRVQHWWNPDGVLERMKWEAWTVGGKCKGCACKVADAETKRRAQGRRARLEGQARGEGRRGEGPRMGSESKGGMDEARGGALRTEQTY